MRLRRLVYRTIRVTERARDVDGITTDATLAGTVVGDDAEFGLLIEFDHNGDDLIDGSVYSTHDETEGDTFEYFPIGLEAGQHTVRARVKEFDEHGAAILGAWTSMTFTLQENSSDSENPVIESVALSNDTGNSSTDGSTSDGTIVGTVGGATQEILDGTTIEVDVNGDYFADATITQDGTGQFTFTPADLNEGRNTLRFRAITEGAYSTESSGWKELSFVYSADPDGTEAQALAVALTTYNTDWQSAETLYNTAIANAETDLQQAIQDADGLHNTETSSAAALRKQALDAAESVYDAALTTAETTYDTARATAIGQYNTALAASGSDSVNLISPFDASSLGSNLDHVPFGFESLPTSLDAFDVDNADSPVASLGYDGFVYQFGQDTVYQDLITDAEQTFNQSQKTADDVLQSAIDVAEAAYKTAVDDADDLLNGTNDSAEDVYQNDVQGSTAITTLELDESDFRGRLQTAIDIYRDQRASTLEANEAETTLLYQAFTNAVDGLDGSVTLEEPGNLASGLVSFSSSTNGSLYDQVLSETFNPAETPASTGNVFTDTNIDLETFNASESEFRLAVTGAITASKMGHANALFALQTENHQTSEIHALSKISAVHLMEEANAGSLKTKRNAIAGAKHVRIGSRANARATYEKTVAQAEQERDAATAAARRDYSVTMAVAESTLEIARTTATQTVLAVWDAATNTEWSSYQLELATQQVAYVTAVSAAGVARTTAFADSELADALGSSLTRRTWSDDKTDTVLAQELGRSTSRLTYLEALNGATEVRSKGEAAAWKGHQTTSVQTSTVHSLAASWATLSRSTGVAQSAQQYETEFATLLGADPAGAPTTGFSISAGASDELHFGGIEAKQQSIFAARAGYDQRAANVFHAYSNSTANADEAYGESRHTLQRDYEQSIFDLEETEGNSKSDARQTEEIEFSTLQLAATNTLTQATSAYQTDEATREQNRTIAEAGFERTYRDALSDARQTVANSGATSLVNFQDTTAADRVTTLTAWNASEGTDWSQYQLDLAVAEQTRVNALGVAYLTRTDELELATKTASQDRSLKEEARVIAQADAQHALDTAIANAEKARKNEWAIERNVRSGEGAVAKGTHRVGVLGANKIYRSANANQKYATASAGSATKFSGTRVNAGALLARNATQALGRFEKAVGYTSQYLQKQQAVLDIDVDFQAGDLTSGEAETAVDAAVGMTSTLPDYVTDYNNAVTAADAQINAADPDYQTAIDNSEEVVTEENATQARDDRNGNAAVRQTRVNALASVKTPLLQAQNNIKVGLANKWHQLKSKVGGEVDVITRAQEVYSNAITLANETWTVDNAQIELTRSTNTRATESTWATTFNDLTATNREANTAAYGTYEVGVYTTHFNQLDTSVDASSPDWQIYQRDMAAANVTWATAQATAQNANEVARTATNATFFTAQQTANNVYQSAADTREFDFVTGLSALELAKAGLYSEAIKVAERATQVLAAKQQWDDAQNDSTRNMGVDGIDITLNTGLAQNDVDTDSTRADLDYDLAVGGTVYQTYNEATGQGEEFPYVNDLADINDQRLAVEQTVQLTRHVSYDTLRQTYNTARIANAATRLTNRNNAESVKLASRQAAETAYETARAALEATREMGQINTEYQYALDIAAGSNGECSAARRQ